MDEKLLKECRRVVRSIGYHDIRKVGIWKGFLVIEPIFSDNNNHFIGLPHFLLVKGEKIEFAKTDNIFKIMEHFSKSL